MTSDSGALGEVNPTLTGVDRRLLYALAAGLTIKEVAIVERVRTLKVENRIRKLRLRCGARTTTELVAMSLSYSWIPPAHRRE